MINSCLACMQTEATSILPPDRGPDEESYARHALGVRGYSGAAARPRHRVSGGSVGPCIRFGERGARPSCPSHSHTLTPALRRATRTRMVKLIFLCRRRPELTHEQYVDMLLRGHVPLAL